MTPVRYDSVFTTSRKTCKNNHYKWMVETLGSGHDLKEENQPLSERTTYLFGLLIVFVFTNDC